MPLTPFRRRDPVRLAVAALAVTLALVVVALTVGDLPIGATYSAAFAESAGLREKEEVMVAGVKVGEVTRVDLEGDHVRVDMRLGDDVRLGTLTRAEIKIRTLLGSHYVMLEPHGSGTLRTEIPVSRTAVPYEIVPAVADLSQAAASIDTKGLESAMKVLAQTVDTSAPEIRSSLAGLGRLSRTIAARDDRLHELVRHARTVTGLIASRDEDLRAVIGDGDLVLREIAARRAVVHGLLVNTVALSRQIDGLIGEDRARLKPALRQLRSFTAILRRNEDSLDRSLTLLGPFTRQFTDAIGNGRWFDSIIQNLLPVPASVQTPDFTLGGLAR
ncbi:MCE family protein [Nonomuraea sediminis]|uniref:MCE family protein n=1 Tax=Nonomuraea sediminis TaxID=2835864 RepID=UPI001BDD9646|nr:MCE family protein [Nonomuraea sediminis]